MRFSYSEWYILFKKYAMFGFSSMLSYQGIKQALQRVQVNSEFDVPSLERKDLTEALNTAVSEGILVVKKYDKKFYKFNLKED